jgi:putative PIN family toxin of toxin-antitoxin system
MEEFEEVLQRDKFQKRLVQNGLSAQEIVSRFQAAAMIVESPSIPVPPTLRDSDDIHVLACARSACANAIVTGDSDLLSMKAFEGIPILSVRQLLEKLGISAV